MEEFLQPNLTNHFLKNSRMIMATIAKEKKSLVLNAVPITLAIPMYLMLLIRADRKTEPREALGDN